MDIPDLDQLSDEELLEYAREVTGSTVAPAPGTIPNAFRRLAAMVDELKKETT